MTAPTINGTRYPQPVDALLPRARELAAELGKVPSRNQLMREYRIGAPKAEELRDLLVAEQGRPSLAPLPAPVGSAAHGPSCACPLCNRIRDAVADRERQDVDTEPAADPWAYSEPTGPDPTEPGPAVTDPVDVPLGPAAGPDRTRVSEPAEPTPDPVPVTAPTPVPPPPVAAPATLPTPADTRPTEPGPAPDTTPKPAPAADPIPQASTVSHPDTPTPSAPRKRAVVWPVVLLALPAFVAIWSGWVGLGGLTGFGVVHPLPGIADSVSLDTAITLPIGVETYGAYALYIWLSGRVPPRARTFAKWSAIGSLAVGALGQVAYHLLVAPPTGAPWWITTAVSVLPVAVLGMGAALAHLVREDS